MIKVYHFTKGNPNERTPIEVALFRAPDDVPYVAELFRKTARAPAFSPFDHYEMVAEVESDDLDEVFEKTNSIDAPWVFNQGVAPVRDRLRSTSVGDVMVLGEVAYVVAGMGFERI
jgi:hypothetical protein